MQRFAGIWAFLFVVGSLLGAAGSATPVWASATSAPNGTDAAVVVTGAESPFGHVLFGAVDRALYVLSFDAVGSQGSPAVSHCTGSCASAWPPLLAPGPSGPFQTGGGVRGDQLGTILRSDGTYQVTYFGHPLYRFVRDTSPGQTNGENVAAFNGIWDLLTIHGQPDAGDATVTLELTTDGPALATPTANSTHRSLYLLTTDPPGQTTCFGNCARIWPPLLTTHKPSAGPGVLADGLGTLRRPDDTLQVTYFGQPLYLFAFDLTPGAASGLTNGEYFVDQFNHGVWYLVAPSGVANPGAAPVASEPSSFGTILAINPPAPGAGRPFAVYAFSPDTATASACTDACARAWPPLLTSGPPVAASGSGVNQAKLGAILRPDGTFQVSYDGHPLYLFSHDVPAAVNGEGITAFGGTFHVVSLAGPPV